MISNAAVFVNGRRKFKGVDVDDTPEAIIIRSREGAEIIRYSVVDTGKAGMAWDVMEDAVLTRLVAQTGCGCSGMKPYLNDEGYTGPFTRR
jgi:hypothetical protein